MNKSPAVLFFDVNETLLDLEPVRQSVAQALGGRHELVPLWFTSLLQYALVVTVSDQFKDFGSLGIATLQMLAEAHNLPLDEAGALRALQPMLTLPPHPDVRQTLEELQQSGFRLVALTNSSQRSMEEQLRHAGLDKLFVDMLSVEQIGMYKPHQHVYRWAAYRMQVPPGACMMIAAHAWDVAGAQWAGMQTTFVRRPGKATFPLATKPDHQVIDLRELNNILV
jgi:2-haloacid dehalogenase